MARRRTRRPRRRRANERAAREPAGFIAYTDCAACGAVWAVTEDEYERQVAVVGGVAGCVCCLGWLRAEDENAAKQGWTVREHAPYEQGAWN